MRSVPGALRLSLGERLGEGLDEVENSDRVRQNGTDYWRHEGFIDWATAGVLFLCPNFFFAALVPFQNGEVAVFVFENSN